MFLERILKAKRVEIGRLREVYAGDYFRKRAATLPPVRSLKRAVTGNPGLSVIAEIKPASPSKGVIRDGVDPEKQAALYERGGAAAISVLTERSLFNGAPDWLVRVKRKAGIPVLRKDFIIDPVQLVESRWLGADAVLLIAALLDSGTLCRLAAEARELGLETLVEVHHEREIPAAIRCGADLIGINNRNLTTFETDLAVTERLRPLIPKEVPVIGESGIASPGDAVRLLRAGVDGVLVGEYLMRQEDPETGVRLLVRADAG
jgi:indole-3-glycerol phosphate synthase